MIRTRLRNIKYITLALCALLLSAHALHAAPFVYVADTTGFNVAVIDAATNNVVTIDLMTTNTQDGIAISPDGKTAYVPCYNVTGTIQLIDVATNTLLSPISLGAGIQPDSIAITPNGLFAYVTVTTPTAGVLPINLTTMVVGSIITAGFGSPTTIVIAPNGLTAYVLDTAADQVVPIDLTNNMPGTAIPGLTPGGLAVSPDSAYLYISNDNSDVVSQYNIDGANRTNPSSIQTIGYPAIGSFVPTYLVISPNGNTLYVSSISSPRAIGAIDISNPASPLSSPDFLNLGPLGIGAPFAMAITSDGKSLYGTINSQNVTIAVDITSPLAPTFIQSIPTAGAPAGLAITPLNLLPPASVSGCKTRNVFLLQTDYINNITWTAPASGSPVTYNIYRDAALTELIATISASSTLQFCDHDRDPCVTYTYYITSVDSSGNQSTAASVAVTQSC